MNAAASFFASMLPEEGRGAFLEDHQARMRTQFPAPSRASMRAYLTRTID